jgi:hypothetical protein
VLKRIFGPKRDEIVGGFRELHHEGSHNVYSSPDIIRMMKSRKIRWAGYIVRMEEKENVCRILVGNLERRRPL